MPDLGTQLHDYFVATTPPVETEEILTKPVGVEQVRPLRPRRPKRRLPRWAVAVAAAVVVGLLAGGVVWLSRTAEPVPPVDQPTVTTVPTTLTESTPTTLGEQTLTSGTWSRVPHDEAVFGGEGFQGMWGVTVGGPGLVAVGSDGSSAAVWTSVDGVTWSRVPHDEAVFGGEGDQWMGSVTAGGPGLVAIGIDEDLGDGSGEDLGDGRKSALWISVDGLSWSRVSRDEDVFRGFGGPGEVTAGGPGLVAVGEGVQGAMVWTSVDGVSWSRVPHDEAVFGLTLGDGNAMTGVTVGGPGLVAVGSDGLNSDAPTGRAHAVVWTSVDGLSWSRVPHDEAVFGGEGDQGMFDVTVGGPGLVAVGEDVQGAPVWTSADGLTWSRIPHDEAVFGVDVRIFDVTIGGPGLVAVGDDIQGAVVWTSVDGISWSRVPHDEAVFGGAGMQSVIAGGPGLVAVGSDGGDAAVWVAVPED